MRKYVAIIIVILLGTLGIIDLLHPGFAVTHDGQDHIARIANFYLNLKEGILIPRWAANLNWGFGHPILEFLYPFPSYVASLFHFLSFSLIDSVKLVFAFGFIFSGVAMYVLANSLWGKKAGIVSAALYMYAPYRLVDLYVRGDIGEHVAFIFIPLVLWGMKKVSDKPTSSNIVLTAIFLALLILSHNAIALMIMPVILLYGCFLVWQKRNKQLTALLSLGVLMGFLLSAFFWFPALLEGQYTLRNIVTKGEYVTRFVSVAQLFYGPWSYGQTGMFTVQLGITHWIFLLGAPLWYFFFGKRKSQDTIFLSGLIGVTAAAIFLMFPMSNFLWERVMLLQNFQFPWRFLAIPVVTTSLIGGFLVKSLTSKKQILITILSCSLIVLLSINTIHARKYEIKPESFFTDIYNSTTDTGESAPIWSVRFMGQRPAHPLDIATGDASVIVEKRTTTEHTYTITANSDTRLVENTLYFPGWKVTVDGTPVSVQFQDPAYRGLMTFNISKGTHTVDVSYSESRLRLLGDILSVMGLVSLVGVYFVLRSKKK